MEPVNDGGHRNAYPTLPSKIPPCGLEQDHSGGDESTNIIAVKCGLTGRTETDGFELHAVEPIHETDDDRTSTLTPMSVSNLWGANGDEHTVKGPGHCHKATGTQLGWYAARSLHTKAPTESHVGLEVIW
jgi:hypothetical protein